MPFRYERPSSIAAAWSRGLGRFALVLALAAALLHRAGMLSLPNAVAVILLAAGLAILVVGLSAVGFFMLWRIGARGGRSAFAGLVMAGLVLGPVGIAASRYVLLPALHDLSTDPVDPPQWLEEPAIAPSWLPRTAGSGPERRGAQVLAYPELTGRRYEGAIDRVLLAVQAIVVARKWTLVASRGAEELAQGLELAPEAGDEETAVPAATTGEADPARAPIPEPRPQLETLPLAPLPTDVRLQYAFRSRILGLDHDVLIRLVEEEETTFVDLRAATRDGDHDLGLNAELIKDFLRELDVSLLGIAGG
ncbi:uncharacterized protein DUF1499 [Hoeflea marina]|uniref:Uncharacterized protein DUF1499 n=1 Tax=Hoeflea marina TaxID=274592 RepID=A0A317PLS6_9HYPH|nr:DUF1499 domain-containing protein [Hoeflea marina]PWW01915.1 uncharacterized protein DUF1499 [Hoeflea marina]